MQQVIQTPGDDGEAHRPAPTEQARKRQKIGLSAERPTAKRVLQMPPEESRGQGQLWLAVGVLVGILLFTVWLIFAAVNDRPLLPFVGASQLTPVPASPSGPTLVLRDDFSPPRIDLSTEAAEGLWRMGHEEGAYLIQVDAPGNLAWSTLGMVDLGRYRLELALTLSQTGAGAENDATLGYGGLLARYNNPQNFYLFSVDGQGRYQVQLQRQEVWQTVQPWQAHPRLRPAGGQNVLTLEDDGAVIRFYANGELLHTVETPLLPGGDAALAGGTRSQGSLLARFDWLAIYGIE